MRDLIERRNVRGSCLALQVDIVPRPRQLQVGASAHTEFVICDQAIDITYIRLRHDWLYLVAILDWFSRYVVSWTLDETLDIGFVLDAIAQARVVATPEIWNTDQSSHFTSPHVTEPLAAAGVKISMDGKGRATDNIFTERLWRSVKYELV